MPVRRRRTKPHQAFGLELDCDEQFVVKKCAVWLTHYLESRCEMGPEAIKILCWVLGKRKEELGQSFLTQLKGTLRTEFEEDLKESDLESDDYEDILRRMVRKAGSGALRKFRQSVLDLLERRGEELDCGRGSEIENDLLAFRKMFNLTNQEMEFCAFLFVLTTYEIAEDFFVSRLECNKFTGRKHVCTILQVSANQLSSILGGTLRRIDAFEMDMFDLKLKEEFLNLLLNPLLNMVSRNLYSKVAGSSVSLDHHFRSDEETGCVLRLLKEKPVSSTHILLYGAPGAGKSSFARGVAKHLGISAYEIVRDEENRTSNRRAAILACINMTNNGPGSLIIVDEADNILSTQFSWFIRGETQDKGWLNQLLEEPGLRMIWIVNDISGIEESVLRRFTLSLQFRPLSRRQRIGLWENVVRRNKAKRHFTHSEIVELASHYSVSAGAIDLAVRKAVEMHPDSSAEFQEMVHLLLRSHEMLLNSGESRVNKDEIERGYSLEGLSIDGNIEEVVSQLEKFDHHLRFEKRNGAANMNLLFHGPPGSGKSELARFIAQRLDREVLCRRVSDLQSHYVGASEKNIKRAFAEAEAGEAVLVIDEADSLLFSRGRAHHSWEISFTNEFLTHMERFRGILICTTNRLTDLDEASLRRFSFKIGFHALKPEGNLIFYERMLSSLAGSALPEDARERLFRLTDLCPGDFKVVRDRFAFWPQADLNHDMLVDALAEEARIKNLHKGKTLVGF